MPQPDEADRLSGTQRPPITDAMRSSARSNPESWLYVIDEAFDPDGDVPPYAVVGAYPVDRNGRIVDDDFRPNASYRPSPRALGFEQPAGELEDLLQQVYAGHRGPDELPAAMLDATLYVYAVSPEQNSVTGFYDRTGKLVVPAFTRRGFVPAGWPGARVLTGRQLLPFLAGHPIAVNPDHRATVLVDAGELMKALHSSD